VAADGGVIVRYLDRTSFVARSQPMPENASRLPSIELEERDRFYREGGLRKMASPHVHYHDSKCAHEGCGQRMEWIDFQLDLFGDPDGIYNPLVRAWWDGTGFVGRCPQCGGWVHFTTMGMNALGDEESERLPHLPESWHTVAQMA
jgi:hypothetical protein